MQDPLKQGLKPDLPENISVNEFDSNARSTKTRIETSHFVLFPLVLRQIRMQDPLKQGLKQKYVCLCRV